MITITKIKRTCWACPSQWEGKAKDGKAVYIRLRWGHLSVYVGKSIGDAIRNNKIIFEWHDKDHWNGLMENSQLAKLTRGVLRFPKGFEAMADDDIVAQLESSLEDLKKGRVRGLR